MSLTNQIEGIALKTLEKTAVKAANAAWPLIAELNRRFFDHPEMRPFFYENQHIEESTPPDLASRVRSTAETYCDFVETVLLHDSTLPNGGFAVWRDFCRDVLSKSPAMRTFLHDHPDWYRSTVYEVRDEAEAVLRAESEQSSS